VKVAFDTTGAEDDLDGLALLEIGHVKLLR